MVLEEKSIPTDQRTHQKIYYYYRENQIIFLHFARSIASFPTSLSSRQHRGIPSDTSWHSVLHLQLPLTHTIESYSSLKSRSMKSRLPQTPQRWRHKTPSNTLGSQSHWSAQPIQAEVNIPTCTQRRSRSCCGRRRPRSWHDHHAMSSQKNPLEGSSSRRRRRRRRRRTTTKH